MFEDYALSQVKVCCLKVVKVQMMLGEMNLDVAALSSSSLKTLMITMLFVKTRLN